MAEPRTDLIARLEHWFSSRCNGDWEHGEGVVIETLDNPGWSVRIHSGGPDRDWERVERSDDDWLRWRVAAGTVEAVCGPRNLGEALETVLRVVEARS